MNSKFDEALCLRFPEKRQMVLLYKKNVVLRNEQLCKLYIRDLVVVYVVFI